MSSSEMDSEYPVVIHGPNKVFHEWIVLVHGIVIQVRNEITENDGGVWMHVWLGACSECNKVDHRPAFCKIESIQRTPNRPNLHSPV